MAADLTGIVNEGEFFSQHYLDEILERDVKESLKSAQQGAQDVPAALKALSRDYFRAQGIAGQLTHADKLYEASRELQIRVAELLGYSYQSGRFFVLGEAAVPVLHEVERAGQPYLVVLEGRFRGEDEAVLEMAFPAVLPAEALAEGLAAVPPDASVSDVIADVFAADQPPRWVVLISGKDIVLGERARWGKGRYLHFDLDELLSRKDNAALEITAALLSRATLAPSDGSPVHDSLDERSHKHAHGVSKDLKHAAREAVELLGNEYVHWERSSGKKALYSEAAARELTDECLTYLYRLLFLFYAEARAEELGSLPMRSEEYARGYSLESLRELEQVPLSSPEAQDGTFFDTSLKRLFQLVNEGHDPYEQSLALGDRYPPGSYIFRLAGRDRESSASYYTPEVLTRCLVKYSLKELLGGKSADEILGLSVCEPAMGSGAFLVEAVGQLAEAYLERKQEETGEKLPPRALRPREAALQRLHRGQQLLWRRLEPHRRPPGRGVPVARHHA